MGLALLKNQTMHNVTLQINLSPGDISYARLTIPALVLSHRSHVDETLAIVDCCRPQKTKIVDSDRRFPLEKFNQRVEKICEIAESLKEKGVLTALSICVPKIRFNQS